MGGRERGGVHGCAVQGVELGTALRGGKAQCVHVRVTSSSSTVCPVGAEWSPASAMCCLGAPEGRSGGKGVPDTTSLRKTSHWARKPLRKSELTDTGCNWMRKTAL